MNAKTRVNSKTWFSVSAILLATSLVAVWSVQSSALAQETQKKQQQEGSSSKGSGTKGKNSEMSMSCPMMTGLKGIKLHADAPPLLMARIEELNLTESQQTQLAAIGMEAREKAQQILTNEQREQIGDSTEPMSMMEVAMMRVKIMDEDSSKKMCPMCMKMMKEKMDGKMDDMKGKMKEKMKKKMTESDSGDKSSDR
ncbi:hypothetical protein SH528x_001994 [Novipirellula sp. SH528]|uniref:hypothetical protein n=1 Tax=Novipirellula sp. SH528 TaxID=3454466 RepID=UPI003F9F36B1